MKLRLEDVVRSIGNQRVLDRVNLELEGGALYGIKCDNPLTANIFIRIICGMTTMHRGKVYINEERINKCYAPIKAIGKLLGEPAFILRYTGVENLQAISSVHQCVTDDDIREAIRKMGLNPDDDCLYADYTDDMKKRLAIAGAVLEKPELIVLEEPLRGLQSDGIDRLKEVLQEQKERGALCIISCENTQDLCALTDEIIEFQNGKIVEK